MFFPDFPGPKSTAVLGIQNFSWVKAFHLWKASTYQAGATFFSFLTPLQKEKVWKIDWFWQIFTWIADGSDYLKAYIALQTSKSWLKAYGCSDLITLFVSFLFDFKISSEYIKPGKANYFLCSQKWSVLAKFSKRFSVTWLSAQNISAQQLTFGKVKSSW